MGQFIISTVHFINLYWNLKSKMQQREKTSCHIIPVTSRLAIIVNFTCSSNMLFKT